MHCVLTIVVISSLGLAGGWLLAPELHWWGLAAATIIAGVAIGIGAVRHKRRMPFVIAMTGLTFMGGALAALQREREARRQPRALHIAAAAHAQAARWADRSRKA